ncbi:MAG: 50S ribosomal protein L6 [Sedimentisphaerales bacterium]|nr:50S ribosomal protein L6 [Sedimentisphaerales bacterium]
MSRIGKKPVSVPSGVKVEINQSVLKVSGAKGNLTLNINPVVDVEWDSSANEVRVSRKSDERFDRAMHGTTRALIANMVEGVTKGFHRGLKIFGTGYGVKIQGQDILLTVGMAQPASVKIPAGIEIEIKTPNARGNDVPAEFIVSGADKAVVGEFAAEIRKCRPPEPYKGKGIRYADEQIKRKMGKAFGSA